MDFHFTINITHIHLTAIIACTTQASAELFITFFFQQTKALFCGELYNQQFDHIFFFIKQCFVTFSLQKIGDYYRGYVESDMDLDLLLTFHKQQTQSLWGTRQSPSPAKPSTRLMWKSQYVPMDGIPFVNTGNLVFFSVTV